MDKHSPLAATLTAIDAGVIEQSPTALCVCSAPLGEIVHYNGLASGLWGRKPAAADRMTGAWRTRAPDGRVIPINESAMDLVLRGGGPVRNQELLIDRQDGTTVEVTASVSPLQDDAGRLVGGISVFDDMNATASVLRYRDLLDRFERLQDTTAALGAALDSSLIGVWDYDVESRRAVRSVTHDQIHGYPDAIEEWTFDTFLQHVVPEHRDRIKNRFDQCLTTGAGEFDCRIIRADGSPAWIWSRGRVVRDAAGRPSRIVGIVMDVTRRKVVDHTLDFERRQKEAFVSTLAHEIRQPLSALLAAVQVVRLTPQSAAVSRAADVMTRQIGQMNRVVEDLVDATRWARGKVTLRKQRLDVRDVINEAVADATATALERALTLVADLPSEPLWADADPQRLHQVVSNLLLNALRCTGPGGRIAIAAARREPTITLSVSDTGCGIDSKP